MANNITKLLINLSKHPLGKQFAHIAFNKLSRFLPLDKVKETSKIIAIRHPDPAYENHILIFPKKRIRDLISMKNGDYDYVLEAFEVVKQIAKELGFKKKGYSVIINGGENNELSKLHLHLLSGKSL